MYSIGPTGPKGDRGEPGIKQETAILVDDDFQLTDDIDVVLVQGDATDVTTITLPKRTNFTNPESPFPLYTIKIVSLDSTIVEIKNYQGDIVAKLEQGSKMFTCINNRWVSI